MYIIPENYFEDLNPDHKTDYKVKQKGRKTVLSISPAVPVRESGLERAYYIADEKRSLDLEESLKELNELSLGLAYSHFRNYVEDYIIDPSWERNFYPNVDLNRPLLQLPHLEFVKKLGKKVRTKLNLNFIQEDSAECPRTFFLLGAEIGAKLYPSVFMEEDELLRQVYPNIIYDLLLENGINYQTSPFLAVKDPSITRLALAKWALENLETFLRKYLDPNKLIHEVERVKERVPGKDHTRIYFRLRKGVTDITRPMKKDAPKELANLLVTDPLH